MMWLKKFLVSTGLIISCDQATTICDKSQYNEATSKDIFKLKLHFFFCKICRMYTQQNNRMSVLYKIKCTEEKQKSFALSETDKADLKMKLEEFKA